MKQNVRYEIKMTKPPNSRKPLPLLVDGGVARAEGSPRSGGESTGLPFTGGSAGAVLAEHIAAHLNTPFAWGAHDCVGFAAAWVKTSTGIDHLAGLQNWQTAAQAARVIKAEGGLEAALNARFGRIQPNFAQDGDLALHNGCLCLFSGSFIIGPGKTGLTHNSRLLAEAAWRTITPLSLRERVAEGRVREQTGATGE